MSLTPIPSAFIKEHVRLSWHDALWGYERHLIGWSNIVDLAIDRLCEGSERRLEIELSCLGKSETQQVSELLRKLAVSEKEEKEIVAEKKWLFLVLAWLFFNKADMADPLGDVELIYADFNYPNEIASFVRYMPITDGYDPTQHSQEDNERRLFDNWKKYLDAKQGNL
jgi:hypothetical protein